MSTLERLAAIDFRRRISMKPEDASSDVLTKVTQANPDRAKVRHALSVLEGLLAVPSECP